VTGSYVCHWDRAHRCACAGTSLTNLARNLPKAHWATTEVKLRGRTRTAAGHMDGWILHSDISMWTARPGERVPDRISTTDPSRAPLALAPWSAACSVLQQQHVRTRRTVLKIGVLFYIGLLSGLALILWFLIPVYINSSYEILVTHFFVTAA
jgi:hypothetical protein